MTATRSCRATTCMGSTLLPCVLVLLLYSPRLRGHESQLHREEHEGFGLSDLDLHCNAYAGECQEDDQGTEQTKSYNQTDSQSDRVTEDVDSEAELLYFWDVKDGHAVHPWRFHVSHPFISRNREKCLDYTVLLVLEDAYESVYETRTCLDPFVSSPFLFDADCGNYTGVLVLLDSDSNILLFSDVYNILVLDGTCSACEPLLRIVQGPLEPFANTGVGESMLSFEVSWPYSVQCDRWQENMTDFLAKVFVDGELAASKLVRYETSFHKKSCETLDIPRVLDGDRTVVIFIEDKDSIVSANTSRVISFRRHDVLRGQPVPTADDCILSIQYFDGRLGNTFLTLALAHHTALRTNATLIRLPQLRRNEISHSCSLLAENQMIELVGIFGGYIRPEGSEGGCQSHTRWVRDCSAFADCYAHRNGLDQEFQFDRQMTLKFFRNQVSKVLIPYPTRAQEDDVCVHLRSGDVLRRISFPHVLGKGMWQPPLAFYMIAIAIHRSTYPRSRVFLITEPSTSLINPCIDYLQKLFPMAETLMHTPMQDLYELVQARHVILSRSTFSWMATFFSRSLLSAVSPQLVPARWSAAPYDTVEYSFPGYVDLLNKHAGKGTWNVHPETDSNALDINLRHQMIVFPPYSLSCQIVSQSSELRTSTVRCPRDGEVNEIVEGMGL
eukprot:758480-Hanusia_phi.AAC.11